MRYFVSYNPYSDWINNVCMLVGETKEYYKIKNTSRSACEYMIRKSNLMLRGSDIRFYELTETEVKPDTGKLLSKVTVTTAVPNKLYAYGTAEGVVFLKAIPSEDTAEVAVYVPSATGLTAGTGSYTKETDTVTVSTDDYARYADGDFTI